MRRKIFVLQTIFVLILAIAQLGGVSRAQSPIPDSILQKPWKAYWVDVPGESAQGYGVYLFRKDLHLPDKPASFIIHVSADNRYKLFVNENLVSLGPARGDLLHWNFETVDIAPSLNAGENIVAAVVWNDGDKRPEAQISYRTAFILQGNSSVEEILDTDSSWKCTRDKGFRQLPANDVIGYYAASPGEFLDMNEHEMRWMKIGYDDSAWKKAEQIFHGIPKGVFSYEPGWMLVPSPIPQMELSLQRLLKLRKAEGINVPVSFPEVKTSITVPANTFAALLLDQTYLTKAYPNIVFSNGKNAVISIGYAEALYSVAQNGPSSPIRFYKGNRNDVEGKKFIGLEDHIVSDGGNQQSFTSLWWRTYRYIQLKIETKSDPLVIDDIYGTYTGYPFHYNARFETDDPNLQKILDIGWRTARLCAFETYMDCPYYEQLQYIGDTRVQALISLYNSGDDRLVRKAIDLADESRIPEGLTQSRYPTVTTQLIPTFSLWWIGMLHDYWMYRRDSKFVRDKLPGERQVLSFFAKYQQEDGSLKNLPYWIFTDWVESKGWRDGVAPIGKNGNSSVLDMQLLWTYELAAELESKLGMQAFAEKYETLAHKLKKTIQRKYWDNSRKEYADTPEKDVFSQHANALAILSGVTAGDAATALGKKILDDTTLVPASIYFKFYVYQALVKAGLGDGYLNWLGVWHENIEYGMTTWGEISDLENTRSDCHAWGASPNIEFFRTVLGIDSYAPGFGKIKIEPHLGTLREAGGEIPHPDGKVSVEYVLERGKWKIEINLPDKTSGYLVWKGKHYPLKGGENLFSYGKEY